ncbi:hypothetical protein [uncultured Lacinutrix sp.]|uniref:hypothetical protein n=1 Tax=uncultured Lacinutrix sp. TaxID=574032 RepID=UPI002619852F|nr:hypothetical protein [uncultured Lacinutrix sp.]
MKLFSKIALGLILALPVTNVSGQQISAQVLESTILVNKASTNNSRNNVKGSPYLNDTFTAATIKPLNKTYLVRYNAVDDEMEVQQNSKLLILNNNVKDYVIIYNNTGKTLKVFENFKNKKNGFYVVLKETPNISLYRKDKKVYVKGKQSSHASLPDSPNEYKSSDSKYYIKINSLGESVRNIPKNKKKFAALFPKDSQKEIITMLKKNKIKLSRENDLIKLMDLINNYTNNK